MNPKPLVALNHFTVPVAIVRVLNLASPKKPTTERSRLPSLALQVPFLAPSVNLIGQKERVCDRIEGSLRLAIAASPARFGSICPSIHAGQHTALGTHHFFVSAQLSTPGGWVAAVAFPTSPGIASSRR